MMQIHSINLWLDNKEDEKSVEKLKNKKFSEMKNYFVVIEYLLQEVMQQDGGRVGKRGHMPLPQ